jgi:hypothetical protein
LKREKGGYKTVKRIRREDRWIWINEAKRDQERERSVERKKRGGERSVERKKWGKRERKRAR